MFGEERCVERLFWFRVIYLKVWWRALRSAFVLGGLHQVSVQQYSSCPSNPGLMQDREGGYTRARPVQQNQVYSSLSFSFFHWAECNGTDCQADRATAQKKRPYRWWALREFSILILSHRLVQQPLRERKTLYLHCAMALYKTGFRATHNGLLCLSLKGHKGQGEEKRFNVKFWCLFFFFFILCRTWWC